MKIFNAKKILSIAIVMALAIAISATFNVSASGYSNEIMPQQSGNNVDEKPNQSADEAQEHPERMIDAADLLSAEEEQALLANLDRISEAQQLDVVIVTTNSTGEKTSTEYADDFFDYNGYGFGESKDGILLLISMENRDWAISTCGFGIKAFTDAGQKYIIDKILPDLSDGNYADSFNSFAELCDQFITQAKTGEPYDVRNLPKEPFNIALNVIIALAVGVVGSLIAVTIMKSQLNSVKPQKSAENYVSPGSMQLTQSMDLYLYHVVTRTPKPQDTDYGSGGSSTHVSSSGQTHGGSSGHF